MGYYSTLDGTVQIKPEKAEEVERWWEQNYQAFSAVRYGSHEIYVSTPEYKMYDLKEQLQEFCTSLDILGVDLTRYGEDTEDVEKYRLRNGRVQSCKAELTYPADKWG